MLESIKVYNEDGEEVELYIIEQTQVAGNTYLLAVEDEDSEEADMWIFKQSGRYDGCIKCKRTYK